MNFKSSFPKFQDEIINRSENKSTAIQINQHCVLNDLVKNQLIKSFSDWQQKDIINPNCQFHDSIWLLCDRKDNFEFQFTSITNYTNTLGYKFHFSHYDLIEALKLYILSHFQNATFHTLNRIRSHLKNIFLGDLFPVSINISEVNFIELFLDFVELTNYQREIVTRSIVITKSISKRRKLKSFGQYLIWQDAIQDFWKNGSVQEKIDIFPLYFWAIISFLIPMRPTEMCLTPFSCVKKEDDCYKIILRKSKLKGTNYLVEHNLNDFELVEFVIKDEIAKDILLYINYTKEITRNFLFVSPRNNKKRNFGVSIYNSNSFCLDKRNFFETYLEKSDKYDYVLALLQYKSIECVDTYDSRHIAIINLHFQGVPISQIQRLAGQSTIEMASYYGSNFTDFIDAMSIQQYINKNKHFQDKHKNLIINLEQIDASESNSDSCTSRERKLDPKNIRNCIENKSLDNCYACVYYKPSKEELMKDIVSIKKACNDKENEIKEFLEVFLEKKGLTQSLDQLFLELQHHLHNYQSLQLLKLKENF